MDYLTRGTVRVLSDIAKKSDYKSDYELLDIVCEELVRRYPGSKLDYQLQRMQLQTTGDVLEAIDMMKELKLI